jgi:hypothetical protein
MLFEQQRWIDSKLLAASAESAWSDLTRAQSFVFGQIESEVKASLGKDNFSQLIHLLSRPWGRDVHD